MQPGKDYHLRYPIGKFQEPAEYTDSLLEEFISDIAGLPAQLAIAMAPMSEERLSTPYRPGGWTVSEVVHHLADSHMNAYIRFKWALTEDNPTIKAYDEQAWNRCADVEDTPAQVSLQLLEYLHERWAALLRSLDRGQLDRSFVHPENGQTTLRREIARYAWHGRHHLAHVNLVSTQQ